jgi:hypothetical protein
VQIPAGTFTVPPSLAAVSAATTSLYSQLAAVTVEAAYTGAAEKKPSPMYNATADSTPRRRLRRRLDVTDRVTDIVISSSFIGIR